MQMVERILEKFAVITAAAVGIYMLAVSMRLGPGVGGDAVIYITSAKNLLAGNGLGLVNPAGDFRLLPYFPPFYPLFLAFFGLLGFSIAKIAGILNIVLFTLTIILIGLWIKRTTKNTVASFLGSLLLACSPILIPAYSWAMSEPLCIFLGTTGLILFDRYLEYHTPRSLIGSAICCGLSFLTRYSAAAYIAMGGIFLLCFQKQELKKRISSAFQFGLISIFPMILWLVYDLQKTATVASRSMMQGTDFNAELTRFNEQMKSVFLQWMIPDSWIENPVYPAWINEILYVFVILLPLVSLLYGIFRNLRKRSSVPEQWIPRMDNMLLILSGFYFIYWIVIFGVSVMTFPPITIGPRMFTPIHVAFLWLLAILFAWIDMALKKKPYLRVISMILLFGFTAFYGLRAIRIAHQNAIDGLGYHAVRWKESDVVDYLRENVPQDQLIVTNEETALLFLMNRTSWPMHEVYVQEPDPDFYHYETGPVKATDFGRAAFQRGEALLVVFDSFEDQMQGIYGENTKTRISTLLENLQVVFDGDDGTIYQLNQDS